MGFSTGGAAYSGPKEVSYLFVDGGYLRKMAERVGNDLFGGSEPPIDYGVLGAGFTKCFYYDCLPAPRAGEEPREYEARVSRQRSQLSAIRSLHGWHVVEGVTAGKGSRARQKQVDVHITVDMLTHSYHRNMHRAAFIAGDQDFKPLVEAVVREGMFIEIWYERSSGSVDLLDAADARSPLDVYSLYRRGYVEQWFRDAHPLPERSFSSEPLTGTAILERIGESNGAPVELYRSENGYVIVRPAQEYGKQSMSLTHDDLGFLERVSASVSGKISWAKAPAVRRP